MKIKFLIIRLSSIGDIVLTTPLIRCLKTQVQDAEVHYAVKKKFAGIVQSNPYITRVHVFDNNLAQLISELKSEKFDYVIDLHQNFRSNRIKSNLGLPAFSFEKLNIQKFLLVKFKINRLPDKHIVDRYLETASVFDVTDDGKGLDYFIPEDLEFGLDNLPEAFRNGYIAFVIAGTYYTKKLPPEKIAEICKGIQHPVILLGGEKEFEAGEQVRKMAGGQILNLAGKISLNESAFLVKHSQAVLTNDTGLMHIAAAFKKKILSFWGNTVPAFGMIPFRPHKDSQIMEVDGLKCRPCSKLGYQKCPKKHFRCMYDIDIRAVIDWVERNVERGG